MAAKDSATLCSNNCGFFANPNHQNLCSLCYANFLKQTLTGAGRCLWPSEISADFAGACEPAGKGGNRCKTCRKKVGLLGFKCRCGDSFCGKHRHPEEHSCAVDRKSTGREILANQIVECKADKLEFRV